MNSKIWAAGLALSATMLSAPAHASYIMNGAESGANVVFTGSGSVNTTALTYDSVAPPLPLVYAGAGLLYLGALSDQYNGISGPVAFGTGGPAFNFSNPAVGAGIGLVGNTAALLVPNGYTSGTVLGTTTFTFASQTFATLGLTPGSYVWHWGSGGTADSYTLNIGSAPSGPSVPEPTSWAMLILGMGLVGGTLRRTRANVSVRHNFA